MKMMKRINPVTLMTIIVATCALINMAVALTTAKQIDMNQIRAEKLFSEVENFMTIEESKVDTSYIENWCGDFSDGAIRMVCAQLYGKDNHGDPIVIDESNEVWTLTAMELIEEDFLLLWIADNHTVDDVTDDIVVKVWKEPHYG